MTVWTKFKKKTGDRRKRIIAALVKAAVAAGDSGRRIRNSRKHMAPNPPEKSRNALLLALFCRWPNTYENKNTWTNAEKSGTNVTTSIIADSIDKQESL